MYRSTILFAAIMVLQLAACGYQNDASGDRKLLPNPLPSELPFEITGQLHKVWAGNECQLSVGETAYYLILQGVKQPDHESYGQPTRDQLRMLVGQGPIRAVINCRDQYQRGIARLYVGDRDVNLEMILGGFARHDGTQFEGWESFVAAEKIAREQKKGIWHEH